MPKTSFDYNSVAGDYQYRVMHQGPRMQRFWHAGKLMAWDEMIAPVIHDDVHAPIIEVGCGAGILLQHLVDLPELKVGVDINFQALTFLSRRFSDIGQQKRLLPVVSYGERLPFADNYFGGVILSEVIEHLSNPGSILQEVNRVLRPGGWCYLTTPNYRSFWLLMERMIDFFGLTPRMAGEQHITHFNGQKLLVTLEGWQVELLTSFYCCSPFFAMVSEKLAKWALKRECEGRLNGGMLLACLARKPASA